MKYHPALSISLAVLGAISQTPELNAAENSVNGTKQSSSEVLLIEQGTLNRNSPVLPSDGSRYQLYSFRGTEGQSVRITLESRDFDSYLILLDDNENTLAENDDVGETTNAAISITLPYTGLYQVIVNTYGPGEEGAFTLTVEGLGRSSSTPRESSSSCDYAGYAGNYAQVRTQNSDPLLVRDGPNGNVIGSIPSGWQVRVYETDATGNWTRIGTHFGEESDRDWQNPNRTLFFGRAPDFSPGWVSTAYLVDLGFHCQKPNWERSLLQPMLFGHQEVTVGENWVAIGDRLASTAQSND